MRHLLIADSHIHPFTAFNKGGGEDATNTRFLKTLEIIDEVRKEAIAAGIKSVIHLGDIFHTRVRIPFELWNLTYACLRRFKESGLTLTIIKGNHDLILRGGDSMTIESFQDIAHIVDQPTKFGDRITMLPYTHNFSLAIEWTKQTDAEQIVLHHLDIIGSDTGLGFISEIGIEKSTFEKFRLVLGGHYHKRQQLSQNIHYIGCVCPQDYNCPEEPGRYCILDDVTGSVTWFENSAPRFVVFDPRAEQPIDLNKLKGSYVKVLHAKDSRYDLWLESQGALAWMFSPPVKTETVLVREGAQQLQASTPEAICDAWLQTKAVPPEQASELRRIGISLLEAT